MIEDINLKIKNEKQDASSLFQNTLPLSSDDLLDQLNKWNIEFRCYNHIPLKTVKESKLHQSQFLSYNEGGGHIKNLYLRDHKKNNILLIAEQDCLIDLKNISGVLGVGRISFGSPDRLFENLGVRPGAVTPFAMINGVKKNVRLFIDSKLKQCLKIYAHPLVNDRTIEISIKSLEKFFNKIEITPNWVNLN